ncbi:bestrophin-3-like [Galendromus occidentalis]|uniref:Bestrophin-3-like n=1 Tax=Galendromus occidentalis TaxID=34638 RepID=A0AAJ6W0X3_9ACAR|nr:bestrophin-3-like [Galendromus occidentalis]
MTVSYQYDVASTSSGGFIRLLFRWKGSVWKLVYYELSLLALGYASLSLLYRYAFNEDQRQIFERIVYHCAKFMDKIPLSFLLGFYVSFTATRWWSQYMAIPWPDRVMNVVSMYVPGTDERSRMLRRTLMRYLNLTLILVLRSISKAVKRRFPTREHLIEAGFMTKLEADIWMSIPSNEFNTFWVPCTWFINLLREAKMDCRVTDGFGVKLIMEEFNDFRAKCGLLWSYDWISIPLVYTQVVTLATYAFFAAALFGRQYVQSNDPLINQELKFDFYVPAFTVVQYFLYMGLLKVAEQLINPFGDDDEDFELNWIIDRHIKVCYLGVDTLCGPPPPLVKDSYFSKMDYKLPYTAASVAYKKKTYRGSAAWMQVPQKEQSMVVPEVSEEDYEAQASSEEVQLKSSTWNLLKSHRHSIAVSKDVSSVMEKGDSTLHIYFKAPTPSASEQRLDEDPNGLPQDPNRLQLPADNGSVDQTVAPVKAPKKKMGIFGKKTVKVQAWKGPEADYDNDPRSPSKVTFVDDTTAMLLRRLSSPALRNMSSSQPDLHYLAISKAKLRERLNSATINAERAERSRGALEHMLMDPKILAETELLIQPLPGAWIHHRSMPNLLIGASPASTAKPEPAPAAPSPPPVEPTPPADVVIDIEPPSRDSESPESEYVMKFLKDRMVVLPKQRAASVESLITRKRYPLLRKRSTSLDSYTPPPSPEPPVVTISLTPKTDITVEAVITPKSKTPSPPPPPPPPKEQQPPQPPPLPPKPKPPEPETPPETSVKPKFRFRKPKEAEPTKPVQSYLQEKSLGASRFRRQPQIPGLIKPPPLPFCAEMPKLRPVQLSEDKEDDRDDPAGEGELSMLSPQTEHLLKPSQLRRISRQHDPKSKKKKES